MANRQRWAASWKMPASLGSGFALIAVVNIVLLDQVLYSALYAVIAASWLLLAGLQRHREHRQHQR